MKFGTLTVLFCAAIPMFNLYADDTKPSINMVVVNKTNKVLDLSTVSNESDIVHHSLNAKEILSVDDTISFIFPKLCTQSKLYPNSVSADGSRHNWVMKSSSTLDFNLNASGLGKAITWPNFTALDLYSCSTLPASAYQDFMSQFGSRNFTVGSNNIEYNLAQHDGAGSMQGTLIDNGHIYTWCSYHSDPALNKCRSDLSQQTKRFLDQYISTHHQPTYLIQVAELPKNQTPYSDIFFFGDSLTDSHNAFSISGGDLPKGVFYNGRWADGLMWPDYVSMLTGIPGHNYAFGGMRVTRRFDANLSAATHIEKLNTDIIFMPSGFPMSPSLEDELNVAMPHLKRRLRSASVERKVMTTFLMGGNDFMAMAGGEIERNYPMVSESLVNNIRQNLIAKLNRGEQDRISIVLFELPDISIAPQLYHSMRDGVTATTLDQFRLQVVLFNRRLARAYEQLRSDYPHIEFMYIPTHSWLGNIQRLKASYGFFDGLYEGNYYQGISAQIWGQPKTMLNQPSENNSLLRNINDSSNFLGVFNLRGDNETAGTVGVGSITAGPMDNFAQDSLIPYRPSLVNKAVVGGAVHPSTKTHFILASHFIFQLLIGPNNYASSMMMADIFHTEGFRPQTTPWERSAFFRLLDYANNTHKGPDFAGCADGETCHFRNGNDKYVHSDGFTPKTYRVVNHSANPNCPDGNCSVFTVFNARGYSRNREKVEYLRLFPTDGSELVIPLGSYSRLKFNLKSPYTDFSVKSEKIQTHGVCKVLAVSHGAWGTTDGRCFNEDYSVCIAGKGCD